VTESPCRRAAPLAPQERRQAIVAAVTPLLAERGDAVTTRELAHAAGVAEGTIFSVFDDKDAVLDAVFEAVIDPAPFERSVAELSRSDRGEDFEELLVRVTALMQERFRTIWRIVSTIGHRHDRPRDALPDSEALTDLLAAHSDRLGVDPREAGRLLRSLTFAQSHPLLTPEPASPARIVDVFLHGIGVDVGERRS
jgi:AcrR family transcriptional regulator